MKKRKQFRLLALLLAACSIMAIASGCNRVEHTTGAPSSQQSTSTAPEPSSTVAPETTQPDPTGGEDGTDPGEEQKYYLSGTWLMNETLVPLAELTGKTQKEEITEEVRFYIGGTEETDRFTWKFSYLNYEDGYTTKTVQWNLTGTYLDYYIEGKAFSEFTGWKSEEYRTIVFVNDPVEAGEVSEQFYLWFTKNAVKISDEGIIWE